MALTPDSKLGPYELQVAVGAGGMGEVYRARDTRLDRIVAIKTLPTHLSSNAERAISALNHRISAPSTTWAIRTGEVTW